MKTWIGSAAVLGVLSVGMGNLWAQGSSANLGAPADIGGTLYASTFANWTVPMGNNGPLAWSYSAACNSATTGGATFKPLMAGTPVRIVDANTSASETVTVTAVKTAGSGCMVTVNPSNPHDSFHITSATAGLQEAINYAGGKQNVVIVTPEFTRSGGTTSTITSAKGNSSVTILDERTALMVPYTWNGSAYVASSFPGSGGGAAFPSTPNSFVVNTSTLASRPAQTADMAALLGGLAGCSTTGYSYSPASNTCVASGTATAAGSSGAVQVNSSGNFSGPAGLTFDANGSNLNVTGGLTAAILTANGAGASHGWDFPEGVPMTSSAGRLVISTDATTHTAKISSNGGSPSTICTAANASTLCPTGSGGSTLGTQFAMPGYLSAPSGGSASLAPSHIILDPTGYDITVRGLSASNLITRSANPALSTFVAGAYNGATVTCHQDNLPGDDGTYGNQYYSNCIHFATDNDWSPGWNYGDPGKRANVGWFGHAVLNLGELSSYSAGIHTVITSSAFVTGPGDLNYYDAYAYLKPNWIDGSGESVHMYRQEVNELGPMSATVSSGGTGASTINYNCTANCRSVGLLAPLIDLNTVTSDTVGAIDTQVQDEPVNGVPVVTTTGTHAVSKVGTLGAAIDVPRQTSNTTGMLSVASVTVNVNTAMALTTSDLIQVLGTFEETVKPTAVGTFSNGTQSVTANFHFSHDSGEKFCAAGPVGSYLEMPGFSTNDIRYVEKVFCAPPDSYTTGHAGLSKTYWVGHQGPGVLSSNIVTGPVNLYQGADVIGVLGGSGNQPGNGVLHIGDNNVAWSTGDLIENVNAMSAFYSINQQNEVIFNPFALRVTNRYIYNGMGGSRVVGGRSGFQVWNNPNSADLSHAGNYYGTTSSAAQKYWTPFYMAVEGPVSNGIAFDHMLLHDPATQAVDNMGCDGALLCTGTPWSDHLATQYASGLVTATAVWQDVFRQSDNGDKLTYDYTNRRFLSSTDLYVPGLVVGPWHFSTSDTYAAVGSADGLGDANVAFKGWGPIAPGGCVGIYDRLADSDCRSVPFVSTQNGFVFFPASQTLTGGHGHDAGLTVQAVPLGSGDIGGRFRMYGNYVQDATQDQVAIDSNGAGSILVDGTWQTSGAHHQGFVGIGASLGQSVPDQLTVFSGNIGFGSGADAEIRHASAGTLALNFSGTDALTATASGVTMPNLTVTNFTCTGTCASGGGGGALSTGALTGTIDGTNTSFTLSSTPALVFRNGILQQQGTDYTLSGTTATFATAPLAGDVLTNVAGASGSGGGGGGTAGVSSLNSLTGGLTIAAGTGISVTPSGSTLTIANTSTGGGGSALPAQIFYAASGDTIASIESECSSLCTYISTIPQTLTLSADHTLSANVQVQFAAGGQWTVAGGHVLTIPGGVTGTLSRHFAGATVKFGTSQAAVPVEWFGATGDWNGTTGTDNTVAIQAALNAVTSGQVVLQGKTYEACGLTITAESVGVKGTSPGTPFGGPVSTIICTSASATVLSVSGTSSVGIFGNIIQDIALRRSAVPTGTATGLGLIYAAAKVSNVTVTDSIRNFSFLGATGSMLYNDYAAWGFYGVNETTGSVYGYYIDSSAGRSSDSLYLRDCGTNQNGPVTATSYSLYTTGVSLNDLFVYNFLANNTSYGVTINYTGSGAIDSGADIHFTDTALDGMKINGITVNNVPSVSEAAVQFTGGWMSVSPSSNQPDIDIENSSGVTIANMNIAAFQPSAEAIYLNGSTSNVISGNNVTQFGGQAIVLNNSNSNVVNGNTSSGLSTATSHIHLTGTSTLNSITGNAMNGVGTIGLLLDAGAANNRGLETNAVSASITNSITYTSPASGTNPTIPAAEIVTGGAPTPWAYTPYANGFFHLNNGSADGPILAGYYAANHSVGFNVSTSYALTGCSGAALRFGSDLGESSGVITGALDHSGNLCLSGIIAPASIYPTCFTGTSSLAFSCFLQASSTVGVQRFGANTFIQWMSGNSGNAGSVIGGVSNCGAGTTCIDGDVAQTGGGALKAALYQGPATAPTDGSGCSVTGWIFSQDGHATFCDGTTNHVKI